MFPYLSNDNLSSPFMLLHLSWKDKVSTFSGDFLGQNQEHNYIYICILNSRMSVFKLCRGTPPPPPSSPWICRWGYHTLVSQYYVGVYRDRPHYTENIIIEKKTLPTHFQTDGKQIKRFTHALIHIRNGGGGLWWEVYIRLYTCIQLYSLNL